MQTFHVTIKGKMPLLMHADNIDWADQMEGWVADPDNKGRSKPGDDRTPPWRWVGCLNYDHPTDGWVTIPSEYIMRAIMGGAAEVPTGKRQQTFKTMSQSGMICRDLHWPLLINGKPIPMAEIQKAMKLPTFVEQKALAERLGFALFVKRARVGKAKHVRVRPRFDNWSTTGEVYVTNDLITLARLEKILEIAGRDKGLGDWRPSAPTPGPFGTFEVTVR